MRPKLHEIADIAEVSEATVSRVMNGRPGVADATRTRVLDALNQLGYHLGSERTRSAGIIGIITPEFDNPIFPLFAQLIEAQLARHGLLAVVGPATPTTAHERDYLEHFTRIGATGVVVINGSYAQQDIGYSTYEQLLKDGLAVVLVNGVFFPCPIPAVVVDIANAATAGVRHLASLGHTRIGCLSGPMRYASSQDLVRGYGAATARLGLEPNPALIAETLFTSEGARSATIELLAHGATGVITGSDVMALGVIAAAEAQGLRVPEDLSVVGFDGTPILALSGIPLTTVRQPVHRMAQAVTSMVLAQFENGDRPTAQVFQAEVVAGSTTARAPLQDAVAGSR